MLSFSKLSVFVVHAKTISWCFRNAPLSTAFSKVADFGDRKRHLREDGRPKWKENYALSNENRTREYGALTRFSSCVRIFLRYYVIHSKVVSDLISTRLKVGKKNSAAALILLSNWFVCSGVVCNDNKKTVVFPLCVNLTNFRWNSFKLFLTTAYQHNI